jgi:flavodoxin
MTKIAIIGDAGEGLEIAKILAETARERGINIVVSNIDEFKNPFEAEPNLINNPYLKFAEKINEDDLVFYDKPKSKYHK